jgi:hypothetical protein
MKGAKPFGAVHVVTAGEAAYSNLFGHFHKMARDGEWDQTWPLIYDRPWPLRLRAIYCEVLNSTNLPKRGIPVWIYALWRPSDAFGLVSCVQGWSTKAQWAGDLPCELGFGVLTRLGSVVAGDLIVVGGTYELL